MSAAPDNLASTAVAAARAAGATLSAEQRIAFAIELVRDITDPHCAWHLTRLARVAEDLGTMPSRLQFVKAKG